MAGGCRMNYSSGMKQNKNNSNIKNKMLLCLALPLTLVAGCASNPRGASAISYINGGPAPMVAPVSEQRTANEIIGNEVFNNFMADTNIDYNLSASVNEGMVTLVSTSTNRLERQRIVNQVGALVGVNQVNNVSVVEVASATNQKTVTAR
jgi:hypothetical protein